MQLKRKRQSQGHKKRLRDYMFRLYRGICQSCGVLTNFNDYKRVWGNDGHRVLGPTYPTLEHLRPVCMDGPLTQSNVTLFCNACNFAGGLAIERRVQTGAASA